MDGDVIGVNTAIFSPTGGSVGVGFSVPSKIADNVINQLRSFGETRRGWIGVRIRRVTDELAEGLGLETTIGALVEGVTDDGPAADAGVEVGDVIVSFNGTDIDDMRALPRAVAETKSKTLRVTLGRLDEGGKPAASAAAEEDDEESTAGDVEVLGMKLEGLTRAKREEFELPQDQEGVLVSGVDSVSGAAKKGISKGDVIVEVAQEAVSSKATNNARRLFTMHKARLWRAFFVVASPLLTSLQQPDWPCTESPDETF